MQVQRRELPVNLARNSFCLAVPSSRSLSVIFGHSQMPVFLKYAWAWPRSPYGGPLRRRPSPLRVSTSPIPWASGRASALPRPRSASRQPRKPHHGWPPAGRHRAAPTTLTGRRRSDSTSRPRPILTNGRRSKHGMNVRLGIDQPQIAERAWNLAGPKILDGRSLRGFYPIPVRR